MESVYPFHSRLALYRDLPLTLQLEVAIHQELPILPDGQDPRDQRHDTSQIHAMSHFDVLLTAVCRVFQAGLDVLCLVYRLFLLTRRA